MVSMSAAFYGFSWDPFKDGNATRRTRCARLHKTSTRWPGSFPVAAQRKCTSAVGTALGVDVGVRTCVWGTGGRNEPKDYAQHHVLCQILVHGLSISL